MVPKGLMLDLESVRASTGACPFPSSPTGADACRTYPFLNVSLRKALSPTSGSIWKWKPTAIYIFICSNSDSKEGFLILLFLIPINMCCEVAFLLFHDKLTQVSLLLSAHPTPVYREPLSWLLLNESYSDGLPCVLCLFSFSFLISWHSPRYFLINHI